MVAVSAPALPTLSQIKAWPIQPLLDTASSLDRTADSWNIAIDDCYRELKSPGGTEWEGEAADTCQETGRRDRAKVAELTDAVRHTSTVHRTGADELHIARQNALNAVDNALAEGFTVGENLSVTYSAGGVGFKADAVAKQVVAEAHTAAIRDAAAALTSLNRHVDAQIAAAAGQIMTVQAVLAAAWGTGVRAANYTTAPPPHSPTPPTPGTGHDSGHAPYNDNEASSHDGTTKDVEEKAGPYNDNKTAETSSDRAPYNDTETSGNAPSGVINAEDNVRAPYNDPHQMLPPGGPASPMPGGVPMSPMPSAPMAPASQLGAGPGVPRPPAFPSTPASPLANPAGSPSVSPAAVGGGAATPSLPPAAAGPGAGPAAPVPPQLTVAPPEPVQIPAESAPPPSHAAPSPSAAEPAAAGSPPAGAPGGGGPPMPPLMAGSPPQGSMPQQMPAAAPQVPATSAAGAGAASGSTPLTPAVQPIDTYVSRATRIRAQIADATGDKRGKAQAEARDLCTKLMATTAAQVGVGWVVGASDDLMLVVSNCIGLALLPRNAQLHPPDAPQPPASQHVFAHGDIPWSKRWAWIGDPLRAVQEFGQHIGHPIVAIACDEKLAAEGVNVTVEKIIQPPAAETRMVGGANRDAVIDPERSERIREAQTISALHDIVELPSAASLSDVKPDPHRPNILYNEVTLAPAVSVEHHIATWKAFCEHQIAITEYALRRQDDLNGARNRASDYIYWAWNLAACDELEHINTGVTR